MELAITIAKMHMQVHTTHDVRSNRKTNAKKHDNEIDCRQFTLASLRAHIATSAKTAGFCVPVPCMDLAIR